MKNDSFGFQKSSMTKASLKDKRTMIQASIYAQTGQLRPNLRRNESAPKTDIDVLLESKPITSPVQTLF